MENVPQHGTTRRDDTWNLAGKIIIVTGATRGTGRAIAPRLARGGAAIVLAARAAVALAKVASEIEAAGGTATWFAADLRVAEAPAALVNAAVQAHGGIDAIVNNAGATKRGEFFDL